MAQLPAAACQKPNAQCGTEKEHPAMTAATSWPCPTVRASRRPLHIGGGIDPGKKVLFQFFHLCRQIGISANSVGGILARQNPDIVIRL
jgi:hypothetical protein